jgi:hypothetical protein
MSYSVYAGLSAQLGRADDTYRYLQKSYLPNTRPPFWAFSETPTNNEFHFCTGVGGALQAFLFGFTGLRLREGYFVLAPILPQQWSALRLRHLFIQGARTDIEIVPGNLTLRRHLDACSMAAEMSRKGADAFLHVRWEDGGESQPDIEFGDVAGETWANTDPAEDGNIPLPASWEKGFRLRVTAGNREVLHVLVHRVP